jgi:Flp pilus assembly protein TadG
MSMSWMRKLRKDQKGNILVVGAASMPMLIGAAAMAIDTIQISLWKRQLQRAADSAAVAAAYAANQNASEGEAVTNDLDEHVDNDLDENETPTLQQILVQAGSFAENEISTDPCALRDAALCFDRAVRVSVTAQRTPPLISIFSGTPTLFKANATAAVVSTGQFCMIALYDGTDPGIVATGNADVRLGCGMATNSRSDSAIEGDGSSNVDVTNLVTVGGLEGVDDHFVGDPILQPYSTPIGDPLASVPNPPTPSGCTDFNDSPQSVTSLTSPATNPKCFNSLSVQGTLNLGPGTYYVNGGDITINAQARITGTGVTIVMTGPNGNAGTMNINGGASINLTAPSTGDYKGIAFYRDRRAAVRSVTLNGGANMSIQGAFYFPTADIGIQGGFGTVSQCLQMVARKLSFRGSTAINNNCPANSGSGAFGVNVVRLVG